METTKSVVFCSTKLEKTQLFYENLTLSFSSILAADIHSLVERVDSQIEIMKRTFKEHLDLLENTSK